MKETRQHTLSESVSYKGIGLHSGQPVLLEFQPAEVNTGIVFIRTDIEGEPEISATADRVTSTFRATTLAQGQGQVMTVEHLIAALYLAGIDNCRIQMNSIEPPVGDGSAQVFFDLIRKVGKVAQTAPAKWLKIKKAYQVYDGDRFIVILPYDGYRISYTSFNAHPELGTQFFDVDLLDENGPSEIISARTIGFMHEFEALQAQGLALGGSLENALVYGVEESLNPPRFPEELVRHKMLDIVGDLALCGYRIQGHVIASQSAHALNTKLALRLYEEIRNQENNESGGRNNDA